MKNSVIRVCKRVNNSKRNFLVLNTDQCKHFPQSPSRAVSMFNELAEKVSMRYQNEKLLVVGFAETATAVGLHIAKVLQCDYMHTTRETSLDGSRFYTFSETHSHATEQKLACTHFEIYDRIVFIEDEITTGNTILSIINILTNIYPDIKFGVASLVNGMQKKDFAAFDSNNIPVDYLLAIDNSDYSDIADSVTDIQELYDFNASNLVGVSYNIVDGGFITDARTGITDMSHVLDGLDKIADKIYDDCSKNNYKRVLVLGTEEFMYPSIYIGEKLESLGVDVRCHSTTRSPIAVSTMQGYPLQSGYKLPSVYDNDRDTYIYNLKEYDKVYVITEAIAYNTEFLVQVLDESGNDNVTIYKIGATKE